jgi:PPOX class probable F420-dependent enzyme
MQLPFELERFLADSRIAVIATVRRDGSPATTPCWFDLQGERIVITMYAVARRLHNLRRDPRVSMTIVGENTFQHLSFSGHVVEMWDDPDMQVLDRLSMRYTGATWPERQPCVSALVEIDHWHSSRLLSSSTDYGTPR